MKARLAKLSRPPAPVQIRGRLLGAALITAAIGGCKEPPRQAAPPAEPAPSVEGDVVPASVPPAPRVRAPVKGGPSPRLVEHRGEIRGPISWTVVESTEATATTPLIVLLHGRGDYPERFARLAWPIAERLGRPLRFVVARAPHPFGLGRGRQWFDPQEASPAASLAARLDEVDLFLARLAETYPEAPPPILVGFSQGAMVALHVALARPEALGGVAALSGALTDADAPVVRSGKALPPVFVAAGDKDSIISAETSWAAATRLEAAGFNVTRSSFDGTHRVTDAVHDALAAWLEPLVVEAAAR